MRDVLSQQRLRWVPMLLNSYARHPSMGVVGKPLKRRVGGLRLNARNGPPSVVVGDPVFVGNTEFREIPWRLTAGNRTPAGDS